MFGSQRGGSMSARAGGFAPMGMAASLGGFGDAEPSALDRQFFAWPIPEGLARSLNRGAFRVVLTRNVTSESWGFTIEANKEGAAGIYVANVGPGTIGADGGICRAMRIRTVNHTSILELTRNEAIAIIQQSTYELDMELAYDPQGYASFDGGKEERRIGRYAFQGKWTQQVVPMGNALLYRGVVQLPASPPGQQPQAAVVDQAIAAHCKNRANRPTKVKAGLTQSVMVATANTKKQAHFLMDTTMIRVVGKAIGMCVAEDGNSGYVYCVWSAVPLHIICALHIPPPPQPPPLPPPLPSPFAASFIWRAASLPRLIVTFYLPNPLASNVAFIQGRV